MKRIQQLERERKKRIECCCKNIREMKKNLGKKSK